MIEENAPAKINLALHVIGQRDDGYHLLQSLVTFSTIGDRVTVSPAAQDEFSISGRFAKNLESGIGPNLVLTARERLRQETIRAGIRPEPAHIHLVKNLPIASGIGGGSADAAATLRGLNRFWNVGLSQSRLAEIGLEIGADVVMCLQSQPLLASGIGEVIIGRPDLPSFFILLVNPLIELSTPAVFDNLPGKTNPPLAISPGPLTPPEWMALIATSRNDLQKTAIRLEPKIADVLGHLALTSPILARMSGSGASCFGLFATPQLANAAKRQLETARPDWYIEVGVTIGRQDDGTEG